MKIQQEVYFFINLNLKIILNQKLIKLRSKNCHKVLNNHNKILKNR